jgi:hypothetical protein
MKRDLILKNALLGKGVGKKIIGEDFQGYNL